VIRIAEWKHLLGPLALLGIFLALELRGDNFVQFLTREAHLGFQTAIWIAGCWLLIRAIHVLVWQRREHKLRGAAAPALLQHVVSILLIATTAASIAYFVYGLPVTGFWATSSVVGLVLGIALRSLIADFFSGIALELDPPFKIGDFIEVRKPGYDPLVGQVTEVNWRATQIQPRGSVSTIYIPNSELSSLLVTNIYAPSRRSRFETFLAIDSSIPAERVSRVLLTAARTTDMLLLDPAPEVLVNRFTNAGLEYKIRYWLAPDTSPDIARHKFLAKVAEQLRRSALQPAAERRDMMVSRKPENISDPESLRWHFLMRVPFFESFRQDELEKIASRLRGRYYPPNQTIMKHGDQGHSMFLVGEGLLEAFIDGPNGTAIRAGTLATGDIFGEMSLLTGDPRSATIVTATDAILYEMSRDDIHEFITGRKDVAEHVSRIAAKRKLKNERLELAAQNTETTPEQHELMTQILHKMRSLFAIF
jgi:small-conductance mechanosensitive channel/CRP-like cAMP-binding protein